MLKSTDDPEVTTSAASTFPLDAAAVRPSGERAWPPVKADVSQIRAVRSPWQFEPIGHVDDLSALAGMHRAWGVVMRSLYDQQINGRAPAGQIPYAVQELRQWGASEADLRFYSPTRMDVPDGSTRTDVTWSALPTRYNPQFRGEQARILAFLDSPQNDPLVTVPTRMQDEFCEWKVDQDGDRISRIVFTAEPPEYYDFLFNPPSGVDASESRALLLDLYRQLVGRGDIELADLVDANGNYDPWNRWNAGGCVHLQQPNNSLSGLINIAARSAIVRRAGDGVVADPAHLLLCGQHGDAHRQSDPAISGAIYELAAQNRFVTFANPVGVYISDLDTSGWTTPDGADPKTFWRGLRGLDAGPGEPNTILRAELAVPSRLGYSISDIRINGEPIRFGGQVAARLTLRLALLAGPMNARPEPQSIGCLPSTAHSIVVPAKTQTPGRRL